MRDRPVPQSKTPPPSQVWRSTNHHARLAVRTLVDPRCSGWLPVDAIGCQASEQYGENVAAVFFVALPKPATALTALVGKGNGNNETVVCLLRCWALVMLVLVQVLGWLWWVSTELGTTDSNQNPANRVQVLLPEACKLLLV